jgi:DeoD family purine-nucleoside phosphorylase
MYHLLCREGDIAERVLTCGDPGRATKISILLDGAKLVNGNRGLLTYTGLYKGERVTIATTGMGAPSAAIVNEELAMLGAKALIRVGTTGSISEKVLLGDIIVPTEAVPLDGATKAYMKIGGVPKADAGIVEALQSELRSTGARFHSGRICTSDTFYLEEERDAGRWAAEGVLSFEMECSVTFAIGSLRGYRAGAILSVTGRIFGEEERVYNCEKSTASIEKCIRTALEVISEVDLESSRVAHGKPKAA